jgi:CheY-like chemotaxis protein
MAKPRVLVVDDKENMLKLFAKILADGYELTTASDGAQALAIVATEQFDVVVSDIRMPAASGFEVLRAVKARSPSTEVVMMTGYATVADAVQAMKMGAIDYLEKPFDPDAASLVVARAAEHKRLRDEAASLRRELEGTYAFHNIIGKSPQMQEVYGLLERAAGLERQRVAIGRSVVNAPKVVLADEPTGNLDPVAAAGVVDLLLELAADGRTVVMVTHDPTIANRADRVVELRAGRVADVRERGRVARAVS